MRGFITVIWMTCKDLLHDARMTICLILTVAAIALPLLLFFGLKNGVVEVMRQRMINDPSFMELIPQGTTSLDAAWFDTWRENKDVGFLVPRTRELGVGGSFQNISHGKIVRADMQPTGNGDWLLESYRVEAPREGFCVLTSSMAQKLKAQKGSYIEVSIGRRKKGGGLEKASRKLTVSGILPAQASGMDTVFVPLIQLEHMESFRDGFAVPSYGWTGEKALAYPVFYSVLLYTREVINPILSAQIRQRTGFVYAEEVPDMSVNGWHALRLHTGKTPIQAFKLKSLKDLLRGKDSVVIPVLGKKDGQCSFTLTSQDKHKTVNLYLSATPLWPSPTWQAIMPPENLWNAKAWSDLDKTPGAVLVSPKNANLFAKNIALAKFSTPTGTYLNIPLKVISHNAVADDVAFVAPGLIGKINLLFERPLLLMPESGEKIIEQEGQTEVEIILGRQNYSRFRMYAKSLDAVASLAKALEDTGIIVKTRSADIERVKRMDKYLSLVLGLIAGAAMVGGVICLLASLYASVERKRRSLAVLRLLGIHGISLCAFPLTAGLIMTASGIGLSLLMFHGIGSYINLLAQDFTLPGEVLCRLGVIHQLWAFVWALIAATLAGLAAALRLLKIEAAEGLRDE